MLYTKLMEDLRAHYANLDAMQERHKNENEDNPRAAK